MKKLIAAILTAAVAFSAISGCSFRSAESAPPSEELYFTQQELRDSPKWVTDLEAAKPITIEDNCWLAGNVTVCGGVTIGEGCVIGAGSVVTRDIPPRSFAAGVPCRVIRPITDEDKM